MIDRRQFLAAGLASPLALAPRWAIAADPIFIADMHFHLFFKGRNTAAATPLGRMMAGGRATLVAWSLVGDQPWIRVTRRGVKQRSEPGSGEPLAWFRRELTRIRAHLAEQNLKVVRMTEDVQRALRGDPHVVLSVEGASFIENDLSRLRVAYDLGIRHLQLVHYVNNTIGDFQTAPPTHNGLTDFGKAVIRECNRLGILVDLAHCTSQAVADALAVSRMPMVWSHSSVSDRHTPGTPMAPWQARQLARKDARAIASKGGVIGIWTLRRDVGATVESYGDRLLETSRWLGDDHIAFGTDMNGLPASAISGYGDLQRVLEYWQRRGMDAARIHKLAIGNYARVLRRALEARQA